MRMEQKRLWQVLCQLVAAYKHVPNQGHCPCCLGVWRHPSDTDVIILDSEGAICDERTQVTKDSFRCRVIRRNPSKRLAAESNGKVPGQIGRLPTRIPPPTLHLKIKQQNIIKDKHHAVSLVSTRRILETFLRFLSLQFAFVIALSFPMKSNWPLSCTAHDRCSNWKEGIVTE